MRTSMSIRCIALVNIIILLAQLSLHQCENENNGVRMEPTSIVSTKTMKEEEVGDAAAADSMKLKITQCNYSMFGLACKGRRLKQLCWCCFNDSKGDKGCFETEAQCLRDCPPFPPVAV
ncbi:hypothetical protein Dimus_035957 [Dionaea muscipula]